MNKRQESQERVTRNDAAPDSSVKCEVISSLGDVGGIARNSAKTLYENCLMDT